MLRRCADCDQKLTHLAACNKLDCRFRRMKIAFAKSSGMPEMAQAYYSIEVGAPAMPPQMAPQGAPLVSHLNEDEEASYGQ